MKMIQERQRRYTDDVGIIVTPADGSPQYAIDPLDDVTFEKQKLKPEIEQKPTKETKP
ncbi:MAG TPA: hypothetical protein VGO67_00370 [Verrucomicrobiae bacterium]|jgi:hypothetical protein